MIIVLDIFYLIARPPSTFKLDIHVLQKLYGQPHVKCTNEQGRGDIVIQNSLICMVWYVQSHYNILIYVITCSNKEFFESNIVIWYVNLEFHILENLKFSRCSTDRPLPSPTLIRHCIRCGIFLMYVSTGTCTGPSLLIRRNEN